jgi:hypothetical protein
MDGLLNGMGNWNLIQLESLDEHHEFIHMGHVSNDGFARLSVDLT